MVNNTDTNDAALLEARVDGRHIDGAVHLAKASLWILLFLYAIARVLQLFWLRIPTLFIVVLHVVPPALFAAIHAYRTYRVKAVVAFFAICLTTACFFESLSLRIGFPFGHYHFTAIMGPQFFQLPVLLALAYVGMGYASWISALLIAREFRLVAVPAIAAFLMVAWDLSMDPVWSTLDQAWVWHNGGKYFGVPVSNFLGWYLTAYVFYQIFAVFVRHIEPATQSLSHWRMPVILYGLSALGNLLLALAPTNNVIVQDHAGHQWLATDIIANCFLISLFVMLPFALMAWVNSAKATYPRSSPPMTQS